MLVTWNYFAVLGLKPELGRFFTSADGRPGVRHIIISDRLWRGQLGADPNVVGKSIGFDGVPIQVVGVAPNVRVPAADAGSLDRDDYWSRCPTPCRRASAGRAIWVRSACSRPAPRFGLRQRISRSRRAAWRHAMPATTRASRSSVRSINDAFFGNVAPALWTVFAAVIAVLLIACANVANLLLADASTRDREFALARLSRCVARRASGRSCSPKPACSAARAGLRGHPRLRRAALPHVHALAHAAARSTPLASTAPFFSTAYCS